MLVLDRLASHDLATARLLLTLMRESGHWAFRSAMPEYAPFAYSLAGGLGAGRRPAARFVRVPSCRGAGG